MEINDEIINKLENLTMLKIDDRLSIKTKLEEVLTFMENLKEAGEGQEEEVIETVYREDVEKENVDMDRFYDENTKVVDGSFEVPKIL